MKHVVFITPPDQPYGFRLAGISQYATEPGDTEDAMRKAVSEPKTGLIIIDERLMNGMEEEKVKEIQQGWPGILLVLPSPERPPATQEDYALRLIRRAIGYHVRVKV